MKWGHASLLEMAKERERETRVVRVWIRFPFVMSRVWNRHNVLEALPVLAQIVVQYGRLASDA
jgi:hypothetical protein